MHGGWQYVSASLLVIGHFVLPFMLLLSQDLKRRPQLLARVAMVHPGDASGRHRCGWSRRRSSTTAFPIHWMDVAHAARRSAGIWLFLFARQLRSRALLPLNDPFFKEAFAHDAH